MGLGSEADGTGIAVGEALRAPGWFGSQIGSSQRRVR